ncbi:MAG TPA: methionine adenosyltransferase [Clostridia bacterium]|nr:MAG: S-adenosylmethionine synthase [Firmicutes bacterium ADurb.Bin146]HOD93716.1 methionine adenosyltransferase [Clostridia bacterium]HQM39716.1 methionine adenosyltransferase [Clostridia bacterium]
MSLRKIFTSESVTEGHPDKLCDQISDAILDEILRKDRQARVACETAVTTGLIHVMGEITTDCYVDIAKIARETALSVGYTRAKFGFDGETCGVITSINEQSADIAMGVNSSYDLAGEQGAGDQGMMFGFACDETKELMPYPIQTAHNLCKRLSKVRKESNHKYLRPDGKSQVTIEYDGYVPKRIDTIVLSSQHSDEITMKELREYLTDEVILPAVDNAMIDSKTKIYINPTGRFVIGGPMGDSGLTGRKIIVDTYGGMGRHGGGAFSGKDPSKVDRSAAYAARYAAKNIVASGVAKRCEIQIAYAIGMAKPVSVVVDTFGTALIDDEIIAKAVMQVFDLRPHSIIESLGLKNPIYKQVAAYGHFGRSDLDLPWEKTDKADILRDMLK